MEQHSALLRAQEMEEMDRANEWYLRNAGALMYVIDSLSKNGRGETLFMRDEVAWGDDDHREFTVELGLGWHNYVAAARTVANHMHVLFSTQPDDLRAEYEQKKAELLGDQGVVQFVQKSRGIMLHQGVFNTGITWHLRRGRNRFEVNVRTDILLNRYKSSWNEEARAYLAKHAPKVNLSSVVEEYADVTGRLWEWYVHRFYEYHYPTMSQLDALMDEHREISELLEPGSMPPANNTAHFPKPRRRSGISRGGGATPD